VPLKFKSCRFDISLPELHITGFDCFHSGSVHQDRGVCIYIRSKLHASRYEKLDGSLFMEHLFCSIPLSRSDNLLLGLVYCSPNSNEINDVNLRQLILAAVGLVSNTKHLMITGDLNPNID